MSDNLVLPQHMKYHCLSTSWEQHLQWATHINNTIWREELCSANMAARVLASVNCYCFGPVSDLFSRRQYDTIF